MRRLRRRLPGAVICALAVSLMACTSSVTMPPKPSESPQATPPAVSSSPIDTPTELPSASPTPSATERSTTPQPNHEPTIEPPTTPAAIDNSDPGQCGAVPLHAAREFRAMWLSSVINLDFPSAGGLSKDAIMAEYRGWLDLAQEFHHNAIVVQIRPTADAFWPSDYAPWSQWLTGRTDGTGPGWDPLAEIIAETHARGIEFHAWFNPFRASMSTSLGGIGGDIDKLPAGHALREHPEWAVVYPRRDRTRSQISFDPGVPAARRYVEDSILEVVRMYDIDAVHFDDYFYPYAVNGEEFNDAASFASYGSGSRADWRRSNINALVQEMNSRIKEIDPSVKFGISPFGIWKNATSAGGAGTNGTESYDAIYADTRTWVRNGWVDYIAPQIYWNIGFKVADYTALAPWWVRQADGTDVQVYIGQADYKVGSGGAWNSPGELSSQIALARSAGVDGFIHFRAEFLRDDPLGAQTRYRTERYATPALSPTMPQLPATPPSAPSAVTLSADGNRVRLEWKPSSGAARYAIYRVSGDRANLVAHVGGTSFTGAAGTYCVSALDRAWNEGDASAPVS